MEDKLSFDFGGTYYDINITADSTCMIFHLHDRIGDIEMKIIINKESGFDYIDSYTCSLDRLLEYKFHEQVQIYLKSICVNELRCDDKTITDAINLYYSSFNISENDFVFYIKDSSK